MLKPIQLWLTVAGPNAYKVLVILEELSLPYELKPVRFANVKKQPFTDLNPNGRTPAIVDPNTDLILWESGAIIQYLIEQYDTAHKLSYTTFKERHLSIQWLTFQVSGQGPYIGQLSWFTNLHSEKLPSAVKRYADETHRIYSVLERALSLNIDSNGRPTGWLVGDKCTYADLIFSTYNERLPEMMGVPKEESPVMSEECPLVKRWHGAMSERESFVITAEVRERLIREEGVVHTGSGTMPEGVGNMEEYEAWLERQHVAKQREHDERAVTGE